MANVLLEFRANYWENSAGLGSLVQAALPNINVQYQLF